MLALPRVLLTIMNNCTNEYCCSGNSSLNRPIHPVSRRKPEAPHLPDRPIRYLLMSDFPLYWFSDIEGLAPFVCERLIREFLSRDTYSLSNRSDISFMSKLFDFLDDDFDFFDMDNVTELLHDYCPNQCDLGTLYDSLEIMHRAWKKNTLYYDRWIEFNFHCVVTLDQPEIGVEFFNETGSVVVNKDAEHHNHLREEARFIRLEDGTVIYYPLHGPLDVYHDPCLRRHLLAQCGDVESNPGPTHSKFCDEDKDREQRKLMNQMRREIVALKKAQEKQKHNVQRQLELEKRNRNKKRKDSSNEKRHAQGLRSFTNNIGSAARSFAQGVGPTFDMAQKMFQAFANAGDALRDTFQIPVEFDLIGIFISLMAIGQSLMEKSLTMVTLHAVQLSRQLGITLTRLMTLMAYVDTSGNCYYQDEDERQTPVAQSLVNDITKNVCNNPSLLPISSFLAFFCGIFNLLCTGILPSPSDMTKHFANIGRAANGFRAVKDMFNYIAEYVGEIYYTTVYGLTTEEYQFMQLYPEIEELYAACKLVETLSEQIIASSLDIANQIMTIQTQLNDYLYRANQIRSQPNARLIDNLLRRIRKQCEWAVTSPARTASVREVPLAIYLYGLPGAGKSVLTDILKAKIYHKYLSTDMCNYATCSYSRSPASDYWEGYTNQPIVVLDDFGNLRDTVTNPVVEYEEVIRMVNNAQYTLNMAALQSKGNTVFDSQFLIASSNARFPDIKSLTDPGALYRRFHIWAEISIDPAFGDTIGTDKSGQAYSQFNLEKAAKALKRNVKDMPPLMTEQYRISLYKVTYSQKTKCADWNPIPDCQSMKFDTFWEYLCERNDVVKNRGREMNNAFRELAGIATTSAPLKEKEILNNFDKIFNKDKFLDVIAETPTGEEEVFEDCDTYDDLFPPGTTFASVATRRKEISATFDKYVKECRSSLSKAMEKLTQLFDFASNKLLSVARFFLRFVQTTANKIFDYLPSVPTSDVLTGVCTTLVALVGVWYTGFFRSNPNDDSNVLCQFARAPSASYMPCRKCTACKAVAYPASGDMLEHFLSVATVNQVRKELLDIGVAETVFNTIVPNLLRKQRNDLLQGRSHLREFSHEDEEPPASAQRVYESQPAVPKSIHYAQKVYEAQPHKASTSRFAQGYVECKTEMHIGATRYAQRDRVQIEQTTQVLLSNSVWIQAVDADGMACRSNGVFLVGRTMITTAHTILNPPGLLPIERIVISNPYSTEPSVSVPFKDCHVSQLEQMDGNVVDLVLITFPSIVPNRPKIISKFLDSNNISKLREGNLTFSGFYHANGATIVQEKHPQEFDVSTKATEYLLHAPGKCPKSEEKCLCPIQIGNHIEYDLETLSGMCGALLSISNRMIHTKLIGFHVAGGQGVKALGVLTTREFLTSALEKHVKMFDLPQEYAINGRVPYSQSWNGFTIDTSKKTRLVEMGDCLSLGVAPQPKCSSVTQLEKSLIFDEIQPHITKPAHLKPFLLDGELVDPMYKGIKKVLGPQTYIDQNLIEIAAHDVFQSLGIAPSKRVIHSYEEAIVGVDGDPYKRPINRTTSPGYPYNLTNTKKGKTAWLGSDEDYITDNPELKSDVEELIRCARKGIRGDAISLATLKDEKRPIAKVDAGKTRVFEACPQHLVIAIRQYFLDFAAHVMRNRIKNGIAVGINPYSLEWTHLAHRLQAKGNHMIAGDFSNFDGSLNMQVLTKICEKINEWYDDGDENGLIRNVLWDHLCNADVLVKGDVIRQTHSQPSGNPLTVIINSLFNAIVMRIAYLLLKQERGQPLVCDYRTYVADIVYGDDDVKSVSAEIIDWFNQITLTQALKSIGLTYTDETKSGATIPFKSLDDVFFLKRQFVLQSDGTYKAAMDLENVLEITNWIKGKARIASTIENCEQAIMELALHPQPVYDTWSKRIRKALSAKGIDFRVSTYSEQLSKYLYERDNYSKTEYVPIW